MKRRNFLQGRRLYEYDLTNPKHAKRAKDKLLFYIAEVMNLANKVQLPGTPAVLFPLHDLLVEKIDEQADK